MTMADESTPETTAPEGSDAPETALTPEPPAAGGEKPKEQSASEQAKKFKLKFGKQEREVSEDQLLAMAQKGWAADEKFQTAAKQQRQIQTLLNRLQQDPDTVLRELGVKDPTELYRQRLSEQLKLESLSPAERKALELEQQVKRYQGLEKQRQEQAKQAQLQQLESHYAAEYDKQITEAIGTVGVPKTPRTVARMADLMAKNIDAGYELPAKAIAEIVREEYLGEVKELLGGYKDDKLLDMLGPDLLKRVQTMDAKRRKVAATPPKSAIQSKAKAEGKVVDGDGKVIATRDEWHEHLEKWKNS